jgi:hypothetical protein
MCFWEKLFSIFCYRPKLEEKFEYLSPETRLLYERIEKSKSDKK